MEVVSFTTYKNFGNINLMIEGEPREQPREQPSDKEGSTFQERLYDFTHRNEAEQNREEVAQLAQELSSRIDYDAVFAYYEGAEVAPEGVLQVTADQLRDLRIITRGVDEGKTKSMGAIELTSFVSRLRYYKGEWEGRGFLTSEPDPNYSPDYTREEEIARTRETFVTNLRQSLHGIDDYYRRYREGEYQVSLADEFITLADSFDLNYRRRLEEESTHPYLPRYGLTEADYDPRFIETARRYAQHVYDRHREVVRQRIERGMDDWMKEHIPDAGQKITDKIVPPASF